MYRLLIMILLYCQPLKEMDIEILGGGGLSVISIFKLLVR